MSFDPDSLVYNEQGLIPVVAQDAVTNQVLMVAWMNSEAVMRTLQSKRVTYWSRSRQAFWVKGETSGHVQHLEELRVDCDRDCLLVRVRQVGPACHTNRKSCFYTAVDLDGEHELMAPED
ncbi:phosphoribosyl-AMP cyclohydrolase [Pseudoruegeria sp. SK021]|uniref:phosphoribosyl-AMP cyclohydrolase n=1 Tax=Pseudoruegeria sp. SK021 TaxID=1933035 RepID=UPI000A249E8B|nr:phosphoribosyl-AMP cyclohydrolase [Pseudoruegeria sp. SK021]OSP55460.1 phosphoribosyl-AMP cyclohydrolase [Pseudoruegeria sp. SK021]